MKKLLVILSLFTASLWAEPTSWNLYKKDVLSIQPRINGWCSLEKAEKLMNLMYEIKPMLCVEIGSLAGATTFPMVCTLNYLNRGVIYAIDAWDNALCLEELDADDPNRPFWTNLNIDMDQTYHYFRDWLTQLNLKRFCIPTRLRSDLAVNLFQDESIDLLYIDGNISSAGSLRDATLYFPKVARGGYIWLNLAHLPTKNKAVGYLMRRCEWIREESIGIETLLFRKR